MEWDESGMACRVNSAEGTNPVGKRAVFRVFPEDSTHDLDSAGPHKSAAQKERQVRATLDREREQVQGKDSASGSMAMVQIQLSC